MYTEASFRQGGQAAEMIVDIPEGVDDHMCLNFWFHFDGDDLGTLSVSTFPGNITVWTIAGTVRKLLLIILSMFRAVDYK